MRDPQIIPSRPSMSKVTPHCEGAAILIVWVLAVVMCQTQRLQTTNWPAQFFLGFSLSSWPSWSCVRYAVSQQMVCNCRKNIKKWSKAMYYLTICYQSLFPVPRSSVVKCESVGYIVRSCFEIRNWLQSFHYFPCRKFSLSYFSGIIAFTQNVWFF